MKKAITIILSFIFSVNLYAQSGWTGNFSTTYGTIKLMEESGPEYPNGGIIYGDYGNRGTISGIFTNNGLEGDFHNGSSTGKMILKRNLNANNFSSFKGSWGQTVILNQSWNGDRINNVKPNDLEIAIWSGKWNTSQGYLILNQIGNQVKGKYNTVGEIEATYNPNSKTLSGTFTNNGNKGYLEFKISGNSYSGKWGWTSSLTGGSWTGEKVFKTNKSETTNTVTQSLQSSNSISSKVRIKITAISVETAVNPYGFAGYSVNKITPNQTTLVNSFGNKSQYIFNTTENQAFSGEIKRFSSSPEFYRIYEFDKSDWENNSIMFELKVFSHLKSAVSFSPNFDHGYSSEIIDLKSIDLSSYKTITLWSRDRKNSAGGSKTSDNKFISKIERID